MNKYAIEVLSNSLKMHKAYNRDKKLNKEITQLQQAIEKLQANDKVICSGKIWWRMDRKEGKGEIGQYCVGKKDFPNICSDIDEFLSRQENEGTKVELSIHKCKESK